AAAASPRIPPRRTAQRRGRAGSSRPKDRLKRGVNQGTQPVVAFDKTRFFRVALAGPKLPSPVPALSHSAPSPLQQAIPALADRRSLSESQTTEAFGVVMRGEATPAQIAALLMGLRVKGETPEEVAGAARALREAMVRVEANGAHLVDTCGTGGGAVSTFNISTAAAVVAAGAGAVRAKPGNPWLTCKWRPGGGPGERAPLMAGELARLGVEHALVVHGRIGMDEIAPQGITDVWEVRSGTVTRWEVDPADHGLAVDDVTGLSGAEPPANAARIERLLGDGREDLAGLAALLLNAGAAIYVAGLVTSYADGVTRAREVVHAGKGRDALERLRRATSISG